MSAVVTGKMTTESTRLLALLQGERIACPPFWEPWFAMPLALQTHYQGSYLAMAEDLKMAAVPLSGLDADLNFWAPAERIEATGVYYGGGALQSSAQLDARPEPDWEKQVAVLLPQRRQIAAAGRLCWVVLDWCFQSVVTSMGLENLAMNCVDRPEFVHEAMRWVEARNHRAITEVIAKVRPDFVLYSGDCAYKTATMVSPEMLREFCYVPTKPNVDLIRAMGIPVAFHTDGKLDAVLPLLFDLNFAAVHGCEAKANDLGHLVETFGERIVLCGNMDAIFLKDTTLAEVRAQTWEMLRVGSKKQRFVAGCNTSPQDYIPFENYRAMERAIAEFYR